MPNPTIYSAGPWKLVKEGPLICLVHAPTDKRLFEIDECPGLGEEAKKILKVIEKAPLLATGLVPALHQIHASATNHHALALKAAGTAEQVEILADGLGAVMSLVQKVLAEAGESIT